MFGLKPPGQSVTRVWPDVGCEEMFRLEVRTISEGGKGKLITQGTCWFITSNLVVTAFHVVGVGSEWSDRQQPCHYTLQPGGERLLPLCFDTKADVALLECAAPPNNVAMLRPADRIGIGMRWEAKGFPKGLDGKRFVLTGEISAVDDILTESAL